ncbi:UvrD-helicase domain-containing protein [Hoyosella altamirensis]|uniref:RecBCD enzyme subunit RecB n=1 Tax=Hoyosella altamirensis TaxID=616997 RepID=A0A839RJI8_9ACTN|nr:UvrD-helicase domain-containing protein [Hoyosella altamirensis]MBB3036459.1 exodeoxyribonuclease V beta subunit [Hoyosella altamirensis]
MFDLTGPLPDGTTILEASAGTGKTYAIVGLAARYVAEGRASLSELLLVTFSRAATQELRERTRERLTETALSLADAHTAALHRDPLIRYLATGTPEKVRERRDRLTHALSDFDAATIATTHSFCQRMLDSLGLAGEHEPHVTFTESIDDLAAEVIDDLYLKHYAGESAPPISLAAARAAALAAIRDRQARLAPINADDGSAPWHLVAFAEATRAEIERRKRIAGIRTFDDLLILLRDTLSDQTQGDTACERVRRQYRLVLVDEFQDTDPVQWEILSRAFHGHSTLILVGDPKQAIYAFRGAEVLSYLDAARQASNHRQLGVNWRSDAGLIAALDHLYGRAALGHPDIVVGAVTAHHATSRIEDTVPLRLRYLPRTGSGPLGRTGFPPIGKLRARVARDLATDVAQLLSSGRQVSLGPETRPVAPNDIAILVRKWAHIPYIRDELDKVGVPSVLAGGASVFTTPSATQWLWLLHALEQPHRPGRVRLAALTPLLGYRPEQLDDEAMAGLSGHLRAWAELFGTAGFAAVSERIAAHTGFDARLLSHESGERDLTDLRHIAQLLNEAALENSYGLTALTRWLTRRIQDPNSGSGSNRSQRLDSEAAAVQIVTIHGSKGLQFPIVYVPYGWDGAKDPYPSSLLLHDDDGRRILDIGGKESPDFFRHRTRCNREDAGEELRLLYVALTRAQCQTVLWWAPAYGTDTAPLQRLLMGRSSDSSEPALPAKVPEDHIAAQILEDWGAAAAQYISVEAAGKGGGPALSWEPVPQPVRELAAAEFHRSLDAKWRRTSYSALIATAHDPAGVSSEPEEPVISDEPDAEPQLVSDRGGAPSLMNDLPSGAVFGTLVHEILETVDTSTGDLPAELHNRCRDAIRRRHSEVEPAALATALHAVMTTPLGYGTLADVLPRDLLPELDFEFPLAGGDKPVSERVTLQRIARLVHEHLPADDPLSSYHRVLTTVQAPPLRGFLTGSIDAVLRIPGPRYVVADYKTNRLGRGDLTVGHYTPEAMAAEMLHAHYPLQALLYCVALHRYLRWRQPQYDPEVHLGAVQYLFVRGMVGPDTPPGHGVFEWKPPAALIVQLSDMLAANDLGAVNDV